MPAQNSPIATHAIAASAPTAAPHLTIYQQHCMERILARAVGRSEEYIAHLIDQLCVAPLRGLQSSAAGQAVPPCDRLFTFRLTPAAKPVGGCLGG